MSTTAVTPVHEFFNMLSNAMRDAIGTGYEANTRSGLKNLINHMSPANRSDGRHSNWAVTTQLILNGLQPDGHHFQTPYGAMSKIIAQGNGLLGLEYMGFEVPSPGKALPKYRFLRLAVPSTGLLSVTDFQTLAIYKGDEVPKDKSNKPRSDVAKITKLDDIVTAAVRTGGSAHVNVVSQALKPGYSDLGLNGRLKKLLAGEPV